MKPSLYIETKIVGYLTSRLSANLVTAAHQQLTQEWWETRREDFDLFISESVLQEAGAGNPSEAGKRLAAIAEVPSLELSDAVRQLARDLIDAKAVPEQYAEDAIHISVSAVHGVNYLLTWNCAHIANARLRDLIESVCRDSGYEPAIICTPEELMGEEE